MNILLDDTLIYDEDQNETGRNREHSSTLSRLSAWLTQRAAKEMERKKPLGEVSFTACECQPCR